MARTNRFILSEKQREDKKKKHSKGKFRVKMSVKDYV